VGIAETTFLEVFYKGTTSVSKKGVCLLTLTIQKVTTPAFVSKKAFPICCALPISIGFAKTAERVIIDSKMRVKKIMIHGGF